MDSQELINLHYKENINLKNIYQNNKCLGTFFYSVLKHIDEPKIREEIFISDIFYSLLGLKLIGTNLSKTDKNKIKAFITDCWTGKGFTTVVKNSKIARLLVYQKLPEDIYSTYYSLGALIMLDQQISSYIGKIKDNLNMYFQESGWVYNSHWTNTITERRFDIELTQQALMGMYLSEIIGMKPKNMPYHHERCKKLLSYLKSPRYITAIFYSIQCLLSMDELEHNKGTLANDLYRFVMDHFEEKEKGFREYQFENTKLFEYRGMAKNEKGRIAKHRYHNDFITASINATTYAILICLKLGHNLLDIIREKKKIISNFFNDQTPYEHGGYGTPIKIAKYKTFFGPESTVVETCNYIIGKYLIDKLI